MVVNPFLGDIQYDVCGNLMGINVYCASFLYNPGSTKGILDSIIVGTVENRCQRPETQYLGSPAEMCFQYLPDVHSRRDPDGVQDNVYGGAVRQERHVLFRCDERDNPLISVSTGQLITHRNAAFLRYPDLYPLVDAGGKVVAAVFTVFTRIDFYVDYLSPLAVRYSK